MKLMKEEKNKHDIQALGSIGRHFIFWWVDDNNIKLLNFISFISAFIMMFLKTTIAPKCHNFLSLK